MEPTGTEIQFVAGFVNGFCDYVWGNFAFESCFADAGFLGIALNKGFFGGFAFESGVCRGIAKTAEHPGDIDSG